MTGATAVDSWIAFRKPNPQARLRLFCFPYAGAGAAMFRTWPDFLPPDVEVCPVQFPGRGTRLAERPFTQLEPLVQELHRALAPLFDKPFAFFGYSLGALVAFELARHHRRQSGNPTGSPVPRRRSGAADRSSRPTDSCVVRSGVPRGTAPPERYPRSRVERCGTDGDHAPHSAGGFRGLRNPPSRGRAAARLRHFRLRRPTGSAGEPRRSRSLARSNQCVLLAADVSRRSFLLEHDAATSPCSAFPGIARRRIRASR